jgi:hypothetical protein
MKQLDLICSDCPLTNGCDEESLWCIFRFVTNPNEAQQNFVNKTIRRRRSKVKRKDYYAAQYEANREAKIAAAKARYEQNKDEINAKRRAKRQMV